MNAKNLVIAALVAVIAIGGALIYVVATAQEPGWPGQYRVEGHAGYQDGNLKLTVAVLDGEGNLVSGFDWFKTQPADTFSDSVECPRGAARCDALAWGLVPVPVTAQDVEIEMLKSELAEANAKIAERDSIINNQYALVCPY